MKVGRAALDEDAIRRIEESNPTIQFDWTQILKGQTATPQPERTSSGPRTGRGRERERDRPRTGSLAGRPPRREHAVSPQQPGDDAEPDAGLDVRTPEELAAVEPEPITEPITIDVDVDDEVPVSAESEDAIEIVDELADEAPLEPIGLAGTAEPPASAEPEEPPTPAHARLGSEGVSRLRARYAEVLARISERVSDPVRREELKARAERLNPDTWVTADEVAEGVEQYEATFEALRSAIGGGHRSRRRRRGRRPPAGQVAPTASDAANPAGEEPTDEPGSSSGDE